MRRNKTYRGIPTKRMQELEQVKTKVRVCFLIAFLCFAKGVMAQTNVITVVPQPEATITSEVPPDSWSPEGLETVTKETDAIDPYIKEVTPVVKKTPKVDYAAQAVVTSPGKEEIMRIITESANQYGVNPQTMLRIAKCESGFDTQAKNKVSTATGTFQFTAGTWTDGVKKRDLDWTLSDRKDIYKAADMAAWYMGNGEYERWECY